MSEKRMRANRRNSEKSTGPRSNKGKQRSAQNAFKHGLSIATDSTGDNVRALAALLSPGEPSVHVAALAVEAARRVIDFNRVRDAHYDLYVRLGSSLIQTALPSPPPEELSGLAKIAESFIKKLEPLTPPPFTFKDLAEQVDKLARYERRTLSLRERALGDLADAVAGVRLGAES
jgi:hypothetical protein